MNQFDLVFSPEKDPQIYKLVKNLIQDRIEKIEDFNMSIDKDDEMYLAPLAVQTKSHPFATDKRHKIAAILRYFNVGSEIMDTVKSLVNWEFNGFNNIHNFLDFASGYGRFTRFLIQEIPANRVWVSDIYANAVKFQKEQFGVNGIVSATRPEDYTIDVKFNCILVVSLFSHLPEKTFVPWLQKLYSLLAPGGMLMFSVHDEALIPSNLKMPETGFFFMEKSESRTLSKQEYGGTYVSENFVRQAIHESTQGKGRYYRIQRGICNHQDLYVIVNDSGKFSSLNLHFRRPYGSLGTCTLESNLLNLSGWAISFEPDTWIEDIQITINQKLIQRCMPFVYRPDVVKHFKNEKFLNSGWKCSCYLDKETTRTTDILKIKIISSDNTETVLYLGTIEDALTSQGKKD